MAVVRRGWYPAPALRSPAVVDYTEIRDSPQPCAFMAPRTSFWISVAKRRFCAVNGRSVS